MTTQYIHLIYIKRVLLNKQSTVEYSSYNESA